MRIDTDKNNIILTDVHDFDIHHIFGCGQCFRFNLTDNNTYVGVAHGHALRISQNGSDVTLYNTSAEDFSNIWYDYFDLGTDYYAIKEALSSDSVMREACSFGGGIRILRQPLWETVVSFIISASNNIPRIKGIIERLCENFGDKIIYEGNIFYSFPSPSVLAELSLDDLSVIRAGFRDKYILNAAGKFSDGTLSDTYMRSLSVSDAKKALMSINGVGNKVSECILLFGLSHTESFPVDVWIKRIIEHCYFGSEQSIDTVSRFANEKFGSLGGYAQQYLFYWARENKIGIN